MKRRGLLGLGFLAGLVFAAGRRQVDGGRAQEPDGYGAVIEGVVLAAVGLLLFGLGLLIDPRQAYFSYLAAYVTGLSVVLGALIMLMISHLVAAVWFAPLRRAAEAIAATTPVFAVLFLPVASGMHLLYPWVPPLSEVAESTRQSIEAKEAWLNVPFFLMRAGAYFAVWIAVGLLLRHWSLRSLRQPHARVSRWQRALSAGSLPFVGLSFTFAAFDWMMSLSPEWSSSVYGVYVFAGGFLAALALLAVLGPPAGRARLLDLPVSVETNHSLGTLIFTLVIFWLYVGFVQLLIIWIADLPAEIAWYTPRLRGSWAGLAALLLVGNFLIPFLLLLFGSVKRNCRSLARIGVWLLVMHYLDVYWLVMPQLHPAGVRVHWLDLASLGAVSGTALASGAWQLRRHAPAIPRLPAVVEAEG